MASIRVEYTAILGLYLGYIIVSYLYMLYHRKAKIFFFRSNQIVFFTTVFFVIFTLLHSMYYFIIKLLTEQKGPRPQFGVEFINISYLEYYASSMSLILLSIAFILYLIFFLIRNGHLQKLIALVSVFALYLVFYSFYNYPYTYRFTIPISSIYILMSSEGLVRFLSAIIKKKYVLAIILSLFAITSGFIFIDIGCSKKTERIDINRNLENLLTVMSHISQTEPDRVINSRASYVSQLMGIENYHGDPYAALEQSGDELYYIDSFFSGVNGSIFSDISKYKTTLVHHDEIGNNVYLVEKK